MLSKLTGKIDYLGNGFVILEHNDLGYKVTLPETALMGVSGMMTLYIHETIRDDSRELFGFFSITALELFWKLIAVSGIGARSAQKIVFTSSIEEVRERIMKGDLAFLMSIQGIGKKTGQKIILELKGVLTEEPVTSVVDLESMDALVSLGYTRKQAEAALLGIEGVSLEERVKAALKSLGT